jgi:hypothetical protein
MPLRLSLDLNHMAFIKIPYLFMGLIKVEPFLIGSSQKLHFNLYIVLLRHLFM